MLKKKDMGNIDFRWVYFNKLSCALDYSCCCFPSLLCAHPLGWRVHCAGGPELCCMSLREDPKGDTAQFIQCSIQYVKTIPDTTGVVHYGYYIFCYFLIVSVKNEYGNVNLLLCNVMQLSSISSQWQNTCYHQILTFCTKMHTVGINVVVDHENEQIDFVHST